MNIRNPFPCIFAWVIITEWGRFDICVLMQTEYHLRVDHRKNQHYSGKNATDKYASVQMFTWVYILIATYALDKYIFRFPLNRQSICNLYHDNVPTVVHIVWWCRMCPMMLLVNDMCYEFVKAWCRHQIETQSALLALCVGNSPVTVTRTFDFFFDLRLNERLSKLSWGWWFETPSHPWWRHSDGIKSPLM